MSRVLAIVGRFSRNGQLQFLRFACGLTSSRPNLPLANLLAVAAQDPGRVELVQVGEEELVVHAALHPHDRSIGSTLTIW